MNKHARILLLEPSKYQTLLIERDLTSRIPDSIVAVFRTPEGARVELLRSIYDAAILDTDLASLAFIRELGDLLPNLPLIILTSDGSHLPAEIPGAHILTKGESMPANVSHLIRQLLRRRPAGTPVPKVITDSDDTGTKEMVSRAVGTLAHEVNNPLMTILGETELLLAKTGIVDEDVIQKIRIIRRSAGRIASALTRLARISEMPPAEVESPVLVEAEKV